MLAEDDATMLHLLKTLLKMEGFQPIPLDAEDDIVAEVLSQQPDSLLMDVHLANKNGLDELKRLRVLSCGRKVRVAMASGLDFSEECLDNGASAFLQFPRTYASKWCQIGSAKSFRRRRHAGTASSSCRCTRVTPSRLRGWWIRRRERWRPSSCATASGHCVRRSRTMTR